MAAFDLTFPTTPYVSINAGVIPASVFGIALSWDPNRTPLIARLDKAPVGSMSFLMINDAYRPASVATTAAFTDTTGTVLTIADSSLLVIGDVIQVDNEFMIVTVPQATGTTATVTRGYAGSTAATHANGAIAYLVGSTTTGAQVDTPGMSPIPASTSQNVQVVQHTYSLGGALESSTNYVSGNGNPLGRERGACATRVLEDYEKSSYYGIGVAISATTTKPMMKGLKNILVTNNVTATNPAAYRPQDFVADTVQKCFNNGGTPNLILGSSDFLSGFTTWGQPAVRLDAGATEFGVMIEVFDVPFLGGLRFVPAPLLRPGTAIVMNTREIRNRIKVPMFEKPRGSRGYANEGDFIMEGAIEVDNETHHAMVSGITGFAPA